MFPGPRVDFGKLTLLVQRTVKNWRYSLVRDTGILEILLVLKLEYI